MASSKYSIDTVFYVFTITSITVNICLLNVHRRKTSELLRYAVFYNITDRIR